MTVQVSIAVPTTTGQERLRLRLLEASSGQPMSEEILEAGERSTVHVWAGIRLELETLGPREPVPVVDLDAAGLVPA